MFLSYETLDYWIILNFFGILFFYIALLIHSVYIDKYLFQKLLMEFDVLMITGQWGIYVTMLTLTPPHIYENNNYNLELGFRYIYGILWFIGGSVGIISFDCIPVIKKNDKILFFSFFLLLCIIGKLIVGGLILNNNVYHNEICFEFLTDCMTFISIKQNTLNFFIIFCIRYIFTILYFPNSFIIFKNRIDYKLISKNERTKRLQQSNKMILLNIINKTDSKILEHIQNNPGTNTRTNIVTSTKYYNKENKIAKKRRHSYNL
jgi:hypothetical protein